MKTDVDVYGQTLERDARQTMAHRLTEGRGTVPIERRNESAEKILVEQMRRRARAGERFASSLRRS